VQANYAALCSLAAKTVQPGQQGQAEEPHLLTNFLDIVSTSPLSVIEDHILNNASVVHQKGGIDFCMQFLPCIS